MDPEKLAEVLEKLLAAGFQPPLHFAAIAKNGSVLAGRYDAVADGSLDATMLAQALVEDMFLVPVNMMFVDHRGEVARVVLSADREPLVFH